MNELKNDSWSLFNFVEKYRSGMGLALQQYIDNAILIQNGKRPVSYTVRPYPMKQYTIQDVSLVDHGVFQLTIIMICISVCCYLARDRGKQQATLRSLSLNEESY